MGTVGREAGLLDGDALASGGDHHVPAGVHLPGGDATRVPRHGGNVPLVPRHPAPVGAPRRVEAEVGAAREANRPAAALHRDHGDVVGVDHVRHPGAVGRHRRGGDRAVLGQAPGRCALHRLQPQATVSSGVDHAAAVGEPVEGAATVGSRPARGRVRGDDQLGAGVDLASATRQVHDHDLGPRPGGGDKGHPPAAGRQPRLGHRAPPGAQRPGDQRLAGDDGHARSWPTRPTHGPSSPGKVQSMIPS